MTQLLTLSQAFNNGTSLNPKSQLQVNQGAVSNEGSLNRDRNGNFGSNVQEANKDA